MDRPSVIAPEIDSRPQQIDLLDPDKFEDRPELVDMVRARSFLPRPMPPRPRFTGKIVLNRLRDDEETATALCLALVWGAPVITIARSFRMSTRSVLNVRAAMADRGELAHLKVRAHQLLAEIAVVGMEVWLDGLVSGQIHPGQAQIPVVAAFDKLAGIHSAAEETQQKTIDITPERISRVLAILDGAPPSVDNSSTASYCNTLSSNTISDADTVGDTPSAPAESVGPKIPDRAADAAREGGGDRGSVAGRDG